MIDSEFQATLAERLRNRKPIVPEALRPKERRWILGFGPIFNVQPGETKKIDVQPKCHFTGEQILGTGDSEDVHLLAIYVGKEEQLKLRGDSIPFSKFSERREDHFVFGNQHKSPACLNLAPDFRTCVPAMPMEIEFQNRSKEPRTISLSIIGKAAL